MNTYTETEEEQHQQQSRPLTRQPWYCAADFVELKTLMTQGQRKLYLEYQNLIQHQASNDASSSAETSGGTSIEASVIAQRAKLRKQLAPIAIELLKNTRGHSQDMQVTCPRCGKRRCFIDRKTGAYNCWTCPTSGQLSELHHLKRSADSTISIDNQYYAHAHNRHQRDNGYVPMVPTDYQPIDPETASWLYPVYPPSSPEEQQEEQLLMSRFHPADLALLHPKARRPLTPQELASLQHRVQAYARAMGFHEDIIKREGVMCAYLYLKPKDEARAEDPQGVEEVPAIAYCNRIRGRVVNVKFRSVAQDALSGQWDKRFMQCSPTTPCAPYGVDSINPLRPDAQSIDRLIFTEGEKDRLTLLSCGFPYVLSIANGAQTNLAQSCEAFEGWIDQAEEIVVCGDTDRPGRELVRKLLERYSLKARLAQLPDDTKDISDVRARYGEQMVRDIILGASELHTDDEYSIADHEEDILQAMIGRYDHGYEIGMGPLTDAIFHPTSEGGLIIVTGIPNSGKTDFLNCMMTHLMCHCQKQVGFLSFELPSKAKHVARIAGIALGEAHIEEKATDLEGRTDPEFVSKVLRPCIERLDRQMVDFRVGTNQPTPSRIIAMAEKRRKKYGLDYLVIDPYVFVDVSEGNERATETEQVKEMLTRIQQWSREHGVWTVVVAHPRIQHRDGSTDFAPLDLYAVSGSAHWANLADFFFTVKRVNEPDKNKVFTVVEMLKVRDQEFCHPGKVFYTRQSSGRYDERQSEEACIAEAKDKKCFRHDLETWV